MSNRKLPRRRRRDYWRDLIYSLPPIVTHTTEIVYDDQGYARQVRHWLPYVPVTTSGVRVARSTRKATT